MFFETPRTYRQPGDGFRNRRGRRPGALANGLTEVASQELLRNPISVGHRNPDEDDADRDGQRDADELDEDRGHVGVRLPGHADQRAQAAEHDQRPQNDAERLQFVLEVEYVHVPSLVGLGGKLRGSGRPRSGQGPRPGGSGLVTFQVVGSADHPAAGGQTTGNVSY